MPTPPTLKPGRCPYCGKEFHYASIAAHKPFPFCSPRCRDIDLGKWLMGRYSVPGEEGAAYSGEDDEMSPGRDAT